MSVSVQIALVETYPLSVAPTLSQTSYTILAGTPVSHHERVAYENVFPIFARQVLVGCLDCESRDISTAAAWPRAAAGWSGGVALTDDLVKLVLLGAKHGEMREELIGYQEGKGYHQVTSAMVRLNCCRLVGGALHGTRSGWGLAPSLRRPVRRLPAHLHHLCTPHSNRIY